MRMLSCLLSFNMIITTQSSVCVRERKREREKKKERKKERKKE